MRGQIAPYIWSACVFIIGPTASIALLIQIIAGIVRCFKKKTITWNLAFIAITIVMAYPVTILFGCSFLTYPTYASNKDAIEVINPVEDSILLGGKEYKTHAVWPSECYAYDIVKEPYDFGSEDLNDYGIYLADVKCPVNGTVLDLKDSEEDILPNTEEFLSSLGNYIYIQNDDSDTYLILAHLEKDSITVSVGDHVEQGTVIAKVGNSGTTSESHLHIQHQKDNPMELKIPVCAQGLPMKFKNTK